MSDESVATRVINVFAKFKKVNPEDIKMDTSFDELGLDSLDGLNLIFELEEEFDIMSGRRNQYCRSDVLRWIH